LKDKISSKIAAT